jgi:hypothetical protein
MLTLVENYCVYDFTLFVGNMQPNKNFTGLRQFRTE